MSIELREAIPPLVRFERRAVEDRAASVDKGHFCTKDQDFALITPPYSKDCIEQAVPDWMATLDDQVKQERIPKSWSDRWKDAYAAWKRGEEVPEDGTPIKTWPILSPAQRQNLLSMGITTVESLAQINDEGMHRYGIGALDLKHKAQAWIASVKDSGVVVQQNASLQSKVEELEKTVATLLTANKELTAMVEAQGDERPQRGRKAA